MKPSLKNFSKRSELTGKSALPLTDYSYHAAVIPNFRGGRIRPSLPSFRSISGEYFRNEARGEFRLELIAFAAIAITAVIPILSNAQALADFLRASGSL